MPRRPQLDTVSHLSVDQDEGLWRVRLWFALYYLLGFALLGLLVSFRAPSIVDMAARPFAGNGLPAARMLTQFGLFPVYAAVSVGVLVLAVVRRELLRAALVSIITLLLAWQLSDVCKDLFHRPRPLYWYGHLEKSFSYPSGHAALVVAFYGFWTAIAWSSPLPVVARRWIRVAFVLLALGVGWSRLALGAHFLTDIIGGYLLGGAMASFGVTLYRLLEPTRNGA